MAETLQRKLACDTCGTSDLSVRVAYDVLDARYAILVFICDMMHQTELRVKWRP